MATPFLNSNPVELILQDQDQRISITLYDENGDAVDATALTLRVLDSSKRVVYTDDYFGVGSRIIKPGATTGQYYLDWGDPTAAVNIPDQSETDDVQDLFFIWRAVGTSGAEPATVLQVVKIVDPIVLSYLPRFRLQIDKAVKIVDEVANCFLGYTDAMLIQFLEGGLNIINTYQPNTAMYLENFPVTHLQLLYDVASLVALSSQTLFAVDTDIDYQDQGYSFRIGHVQPLQAFMSSLTQRIDRLVPLFKLNFATLGSIHVEGGASYRLLQLLQAAPPGALFRGTFVAGM